MSGPHQGQPVLFAGDKLGKARIGMIMIHGRGDSAEGILSLASVLKPSGVVYAAPSASGGTWYPNRFLAPLASNEPYLSSALQAVDDAVRQLNEAGIADERIVLLGFSQGACLTLEYAARHARRYGGVMGLSGALIGPEGTPRDYPGSLAGTPVFLGCSDMDFHIPLETVKRSTEILGKLGGAVTERIYRGMGHTINDDEIAFVNATLAGLAETV